MKFSDSTFFLPLPCKQTRSRDPRQKLPVAAFSPLTNGDVFSYNNASCHVCSAVTAAIDVCPVEIPLLTFLPLYLLHFMVVRPSSDMPPVPVHHRGSAGIIIHSCHERAAKHTWRISQLQNRLRFKGNHGEDLIRVDPHSPSPCGRT